MRPALVAVLVAVPAGLAAILFWLWWTFIGFTVHYRWHQEIRLLISTPNGPVEAASVQAVDTRYHPYSSGLSPMEVNRDQRGEAVVADLGDGRYLFALLPGPGLAEMAYVDLPPNRPDIYRAIRRQAGKAAIPLPHDLYPRLVTFNDIADPTSVALVDPDNLAANFGPGYALERITVAITNEPVTEGVVEGVLGWLRGHSGRIKPTDKIYADELTVEETLYRGDFVKRKD